jgi:hypothetical protein
MTEQKHSNVCYILKNIGKDENGKTMHKFEPVQNAKIFHNSYGLDLFEIDGKLTEGKSGLGVCDTNKFEEAFKNYGIEKFHAMIESAVEKYGLSPRYTKPEETKNEVFHTDEKEIEEHAKLMKPLFINGMFNRDGKRIRAKYVKTLSCDGIDYPLWISAGKPDKEYAKNDDDKYYYMIETNDYLVSFGYTEYDLKQRSNYEYLIQEFYHGSENREKIFHDIYKGKNYEEYKPLVEEQTAKEEAFISEHGNNEQLQAEFLKLGIDRCIAQYIDARDNNGKFADFHGAAFLKELDKCVEISAKIKAIKQQEEAIKKEEREKKKKIEADEQARQENEMIKSTENIILNGGTINGGNLIVKLADKYNINIPIRTRGWILNTLAECTITEYGGVSYRYWKSKNGTGSQKVYDIVFNIRNAIKQTGSIVTNKTA